MIVVSSFVSFSFVSRSIPILSFYLDSFPIEMSRSCSWINENVQNLMKPHLILLHLLIPLLILLMT
uniref:Uncharacterized protein n=1 Tax=Utricularia reniformis TaxID=192314 RepID=A0A1Y0B1P0_9LAMI|nr:hypothetical protein AEK19_MT1079 [Utricularia reniformis]ART31301.1 hypothetical protein AEK19_MT1079 [Utricularia reniformis]